MRLKQKIRKEIEKALLKFEEDKKNKKEEEVKIMKVSLIDFEKQNDLIRKYLYLLD